MMCVRMNFAGCINQTAFILSALAVFFTLPCATAQEPSAAVQQELIIVVGSPGTDEYRQIFSSWCGRWEEAATRAGIQCNVIGKNETSGESVQETPQAATDLERLKQIIETAGKTESTEPVWLVFIGHGTFDGREASWNLRGPDVTAGQLADICRPLKRPLAVVACASCTAPFVNALSGKGRVVITATKDGNQIQYSRFGDAMSLAISTLDADINRDGQTSLLEAWLFASRRTAEFYKTEGRLATEHSLLDDNGDAKGIRSELYERDRIVETVDNPAEVDGSVAARWHLIRSDEERRLSPEQRQRRDELEARLEELRGQKDAMSEDDYLQKLEELLVPLAELYETVDRPTADPMPAE